MAHQVCRLIFFYLFITVLFLKRKTFSEPISADTGECEFKD